MRASRRTSWWSATSTTSRSGTASAGSRTRSRSIARSSGSRRALAILLDMTRAHVPVLAGELIELLDPHPGDVAIDCTFADGLKLLAEEGVQADLVYLDLGISSMQVDTWERGFSYSYDAPLDMRMDTTQHLDAREVVNGWDERRLAQLFRSYGEERFARQIAR